MSKRTRKAVIRALDDIKGHLLVASGMTSDPTVSMVDIRSRLVNIQTDLDRTTVWLRSKR